MANLVLPLSTPPIADTYPENYLLDPGIFVLAALMQLVILSFVGMIIGRKIAKGSSLSDARVTMTLIFGLFVPTAGLFTWAYLYPSLMGYLAGVVTIGICGLLPILLSRGDSSARKILFRAVGSGFMLFIFLFTSLYLLSKVIPKNIFSIYL